MCEPETKNIAIQLETENLILRPVDMSDSNFIFRQFSDPLVCQYLVDEEPFTRIEESKQLIEFYTLPEPRRQYRWIIVRKSDGGSIGTCGYHQWAVRHNSCEMGYDLCPPYWGKGYMMEALTRLISMGFEAMGLNRIQAFVDMRNTRSVNLASRLGFKNEGIARDKHFFQGKYYDHYCFSLLKREWNR
jgi:[ribosomal protein S5]-alanine N-acetyltransferase